MTTTTTPAVRPGRVTWLAVVDGEVRKLLGQRAVVLCLLATAVLLAGIGAIAGFAMVAATDGPAPPDDDTLRTIPSTGIGFAQLLVGAAAALLVTAEWGSGSIRVLVAAVQRRWTLYAAKVVAAGVGGFVATAAGGAVAAAVGRVALGRIDKADLLALAPAGTYVALMGLVGVAIAVMGAGIGAAVRSTSGAITVLVSLLVIAPIVVALVPYDPVQDAGQLLPMNAAGILLTPHPPATGIQHGVAALTVLAWTAALAVAGGLRMTRDI